jgi:photosystem II stability/assembly factor-like uncharacterized protein
MEAETVRQPSPLRIKPALKKAVIPEPSMAAPPPTKIVEVDQLKTIDPSASASQSAKPPSPGISFFNPQQASASQKYRVAPRSMSTVIPARPRQWAINQGVPEQSGDEGLSWRQMPIDASIRFQAIGNLANDVWAGGSGGALVHSYDSGEHWQRVKVVDGGQTLTSDVIGLRVITRLEIHVLSASGEQWATQDGGRTWKRE